MINQTVLDRGHVWYFNDTTGLGEIHTADGTLKIPLSEAAARAFDEADAPTRHLLLGRYAQARVESMAARPRRTQ